MKKIFFGLIFFSLTLVTYSQIEKIDEVTITAVNYKYINAVEDESTDLNIQMLQEKVAMYDLKNSELYSDEYDTYTVSFYIPEGKILVAYDKNGKVLRTIEKFKNIKLPKKIKNAIAKRFPNWSVEEDVYFVNYHHRYIDKTRKLYKVKLKNKDQVIRVKLDDTGDFV